MKFTYFFYNIYIRIIYLLNIEIQRLRDEFKHRMALEGKIEQSEIILKARQKEQVRYIYFNSSILIIEFLIVTYSKFILKWW